MAARDEELLRIDPALVGGTQDGAERVADAVERCLELHPGSRVLEIGCATGRVSAALTERGHRVTAVDSSPLLLEQARKNWKRRHPGSEGPHFEVFDLESLETHGSFDAVLFLGHALGQSKDEADHLRTLMSGAACLGEEGVVLLETPNPYFLAAHAGTRHVPPGGLETEADVVITTRLDALHGRAEESIIVFAAGVRTEIQRDSRRAWTPPELAALLGSAGLRLPKVWVGEGSFPPVAGGPFDPLRGAWFWTTATV